MKKLLLMVIMASAFIGCSQNSLQISSCKTYENDVCTVKKLETVELCAKPTVINGKTYCRD